MSVSKFLKLFLTAGMFYIAGCSASNSSLRYTEKNDDDENDNSALRYTQTDTSQVFDDPSFDEFSSDSDFEEEPGTIQQIDLESVYKGELKSFNTSSNLQENLIMGIIKYLNTPYKFGGSTLKGIDCSALTQNIFNDALKLELPRTAREQFMNGIVVEKNDLQFGDLVFFNTRRRVRPGHVGIYIGDNLFAHASRSNGVTITSLTEDYYDKRFLGARRIFQDWEIKE